MGRAVVRIVRTFDLDVEFHDVRPLPLQIGGMARAADRCRAGYRRRA